MPREKLIFFTGAGISVESGIPTFQAQPGIRDKLNRNFANEFPEEYRETIRDMLDSCEKAEPNAAHKVIAEFDVPVITMNVDKLHTKAGSKHVIEVHGVLPTREQLEEEYFPAEYKGIILYGDMAPKYEEAYRAVKNLEYGNSYFVIIGTSFYTGISAQLKRLAEQRNAKILLINSEAARRVPILCGQLKKALNGEETIFECDKIEKTNSFVVYNSAWEVD